MCVYIYIYIYIHTHTTEMKIGVKSLKSLRDGRVLIEVGSVDETKLLSADINAKCDEALEANVPILRKPRLIIRNVPQDMTVEGFEETLLTQNPELGMKPGEAEAKFMFRTKRGELNMVVEAVLRQGRNCSCLN